MSSRLETYLHYLTAGEGEVPEPISRMDYYLYYLAKGGDKEQLPPPSSRADEYLYQLCMNGGIGGGEGNGSSGLEKITIENISYKINWPKPPSYAIDGLLNKVLQQSTKEVITAVSVVQKERNQ